MQEHGALEILEVSDGLVKDWEKWTKPKWTRGVSADCLTSRNLFDSETETYNNVCSLEWCHNWSKPQSQG